MHHVSIRTANIQKAIAFYEVLGFTIENRFVIDYTLACWMEGLGGRIELIEIPEPKATQNIFEDNHYTGYYHISFNLTHYTSDLSIWLDQLKINFSQYAQENLDNCSYPIILLEPHKQVIGDKLYEIAFIQDQDGLPLEFIRILENSKQTFSC